MPCFRKEGDEQDSGDESTFYRGKGLESQFVQKLAKDEANVFVKSKKDCEMVRQPRNTWAFNDNISLFAIEFVLFVRF
jgi:hypothetical protein